MIDNKKIEAIAIKATIDHRNAYIIMKQRWNDLYERYENKLRLGSISSKTSSKVTLGGAFSLVENAKPRLLGRDPKYKYLGREGDDEQAAEIYDQFSEYQFDQADARKEITEVVEWGLITGLAGWKMGWNETKRIISKNGKEILGKKVTNPVVVALANKLKVGQDVKIDEEITDAGYTFKAIKPHDLIWSLRAKDVKDCSVLGHQDKTTVRDLEIDGFDTSALRATIQTTDYWMTQLKLADGVQENQKTFGDLEEEMLNTEIRIAELYVTVRNDQGVYEEYVTWLGNVEDMGGGGGTPTPLKTMANPFDKKFKPMGVFRPINRAGKFYGFGIIEPTMGTLDAEEDNLNISLEANWTATVPPIEVDPTNIIDLQAVEYGPRAINAVRQLGASMAVMPTPQVNVGGVQFFANYLNRNRQNVSGITDYQTGSDTLSGGKTLGEIQIKTQEANARIGEMLRNLERQVLEPMGKYALWMNQQYLSKNMKLFFRIVGRKGQFLEKQIKFKDIEAVKDIVIISGSTALVVQQAELQKWSALLNQVYAEEASPSPTKINKLPIWERLFEQGLMIKDPETYLPSLKELEQQEVGGSMAQMKDAQNENANPVVAVVLPDDNPEIHIPLHQAEIAKRKNEQDMAQQAGVEVPEEVVMELQLLVKHLNDHVIASGGPSPEHAANLQVGQGTSVMQNNAPQTPQG